MEDFKQNEAVPIETIAPVITEETVKKADETLQKYRKSKARLEDRVIDNERLWKLERENNEGTSDSVKPTSAWLFNCIISNHADAMDAFPEPNILPRERNDVEEAKKLSQILPVIYNFNHFYHEYSSAWWAKIKNGTGVYGVFWDKDKLNGLGDISVKKVDILNLFWEPGITDIQDSKNLFYCSLVDIEGLEKAYPQLKDKLKSDESTIKKYPYEDDVTVDDKALVVDWYYKVYDPATKKSVLHYVKYCNDEVLFATENEREKYPNGLYDHGKYPFIFDTLFPQEGSPAGFGYIDVCKDPQKYINRLDEAILTNALAGATPRWIVREDVGISMNDYLDFTNPIVKATGNLSDNSIMPVPVQGLSPMYYQVMQGKIQEMKETSGNRDVNNGGTASGVTAASAIAAMQEQSGKLSRDMIKHTYENFEKITELCIELIRQFYDNIRTFRITGENGAAEFVEYSNAGIKPQEQDINLSGETGYRKPLFDIEVAVQKENLYTKTAYNEFALQLYQNGFFNPEMATQAVAALDIMDFKGKETVREKIQESYNLQQQLLQWQQMAITLASKYEPQMAEGLAASLQGQGMPAGAVEANVNNVEAKEDTRVSNARQAARERTKPR